MLVSNFEQLDSHIMIFISVLNCVLNKAKSTFSCDWVDLGDFINGAHD